MATTAKSTEIPTTVLPATLVEVPATVTYELKEYSRLKDGGREGDVESLELHRNGKMVAMVHNYGNGGSPSIEIWSRGDDEMFSRELRALRGWIADFTKAGLQYRLDMSAFGKEDHIGDYDEEAVAYALLFEAYVAKDLSGKRTPQFADSLEKAKAGEFFTLKNASKLTPEQIQGFLDQNPGVVVWSKTEKKWVSKVA